MPRNHFIKVFPGNEGNLDWVTQEIALGKPYGQVWSDTWPPSWSSSKTW